MAGVLVFGEWARGALAPVSLEIAGAGASVAQARNETLAGALVAVDLTGAESLGGCTKLYLMEGRQFQPYTAAACIAAARAVIEAVSPSVVLFPHSLETREWVPSLAALLNAGVILDCTGLALEAGELLFTKPVFGGAALATFALRGSPVMATLRSGVFKPAPANARAEVVGLGVPASESRRVTVLEEAAVVAGGVKLKDAKVVVSGGRGIGGQKNWHFVEEAAAALDGAVGCSRPVADAGWVPSSHQVGISGTSVAPELYVAIGISGAVQHLAGISGARTVVAINNDPDADIFTRAQYGVVGDYREVLPAFIERVGQLRKTPRSPG